MLRNFFNDDAGFVVSAELALIVTLVFTAVAVGIAVARDALVNEYNDVSEMIGVIDQSYHVIGFKIPDGCGCIPSPHPYHGEARGFGFNDYTDFCDCNPVVPVVVCGKYDPSDTGNHEGT